MVTNNIKDAFDLEISSMTFRLEEVKQICEKWSVNHRYCCAYRPSGNGIVQRIHQMVK